jgi:hypothetical protein
MKYFLHKIVTFKHNNYTQKGEIISISKNVGGFVYNLKSLDELGFSGDLNREQYVSVSESAIIKDQFDSEDMDIAYFNQNYSSVEKNNTELYSYLLTPEELLID